MFTLNLGHSYAHSMVSVPNICKNYLNWYAYADRIRESKTTLKQWFLTMLLTDQAYHLYELFKQNAVIIRT